MAKRIVAIAFIYILVSVAWFALGGSLAHRTHSFTDRLRGEVADLWGTPQTQKQPDLIFRWKEMRYVKKRRVWEWKEKKVELDSSDIAVDLDMEQRKKGLLWYSLYNVDFTANYKYTNREDKDGWLIIRHQFPTKNASYDDFGFEFDGQTGEEDSYVYMGAQKVEKQIPIKKGVETAFYIKYKSRGLENWRYAFGQDVNRVRNFTMAMTTNFDAIDFPENTMSPTTKTTRDNGGWKLNWDFNNLISGYDIGMTMPQKINPGPLATQISFFAPISLGFFFVMIFVITLLKKIDLHPMNYLLLGAAFFAFHLLFAYTVDRIDIVYAFVLASCVSVFLVVSYLRLVVGMRFAAVEAGLSQLVYLVFFSYAHFWEGFTGLAVTIISIVTLFAIMQLTGRVKWSKQNGSSNKPKSKALPVARQAATETPTA